MRPRRTGQRALCDAREKEQELFSASARRGEGSLGHASNYRPRGGNCLAEKGVSMAAVIATGREPVLSPRTGEFVPRDASSRAGAEGEYLRSGDEIGRVDGVVVASPVAGW